MTSPEDRTQLVADLRERGDVFKNKNGDPIASLPYAAAALIEADTSPNHADALYRMAKAEMRADEAEAENASLRAENERMRAVVGAARALRKATDEAFKADETGVQWAEDEQLLMALAALDTPEQSDNPYD